MTAVPLSNSKGRSWPALASFPREYLLPVLLIIAAAGYLYAGPIKDLANQWWSNPDAGHGLLLFPLSLWLGWRSGLLPEPNPSRVWGSLFLGAAVFSRVVGALAAELYTQRMAIWITVVGLILFFRGWKQLVHWWLPLSLTFLSVPLPDLIMNKLSIPLQLVASTWGTALIEWRHVPVHKLGNVLTIQSPETGDVIRLFVAEACSGLRSLTALLALGIAVGGMYLRTLGGRVLLLILAVPVAIGLNSVRVFLTAYLMYHVSSDFGKGFMHESEGWALFAVAFLILGLIGGVVSATERWLANRKGASNA